MKPLQGMLISRIIDVEVFKVDTMKSNYIMTMLCAEMSKNMPKTPTLMRDLEIDS
jgi:hypothetical protein